MTSHKVIAVVGIGCENSTFSPMLTTIDDFSTSPDESHMRELYTKMTNSKKGQRLDLEGSIPPLPRDLSSFNTKLRFACRYRALPGGVIAKSAYQTIRNEMVRTLTTIVEEEGVVHGVWLDFHGAMNAEGLDDVEGELSTLARDIVGRDAILCASFDLHGNFSERLAAAVNITTAYRTAPHIDVVETRVRALYLLLSTLEEGSVPKVVYKRVPLVVSGEMSNTSHSPCDKLYSETLHEADIDDKILDASILIGYCWADEERSGCAVLVTYKEMEGGQAAGTSHANRIAASIWSERDKFVFPVPSGTMEEVLNMACDLPKPCFISDSGDNPTAGATGSVPAFLSVFLERGKDENRKKMKTIVQGPIDPNAVSKCLQKGTGDTLRVDIAGVEAEVEVVHIHETETTYPFMYEGVEYKTTMPPSVVVRLVEASEVLVVLCSARKPLHYHADFAELKIDLTHYDVVVIKIGYLVPDLEELAASNVLALSPGAVYADLPTLEYRNIPRPFYPKDKDMSWSV